MLTASFVPFFVGVLRRVEAFSRGKKPPFRYQSVFLGRLARALPHV